MKGVEAPLGVAAVLPGSGPFPGRTGAHRVVARPQNKDHTQAGTRAPEAEGSQTSCAAQSRRAEATRAPRSGAPCALRPPRGCWAPPSTGTGPSPTFPGEPFQPGPLPTSAHGGTRKQGRSPPTSHVAVRRGLGSARRASTWRPGPWGPASRGPLEAAPKPPARVRRPPEGPRVRAARREGTTAHAAGRALGTWSVCGRQGPTGGAARARTGPRSAGTSGRGPAPGRRSQGAAGAQRRALLWAKDSASAATKRRRLPREGVFRARTRLLLNFMSGNHHTP